MPACPPGCECKRHRPVTEPKDEAEAAYLRHLDKNREYQRRYREKNRALINEQARLKRAEMRADPEKNEAIKEYKRQWTAEHPGHSSAKSLEWYRAHPLHKVRLHGIDEEEYRRIFDEQRGKCAICGDESLKGRLIIDHDHSCCEGKYSCGKCIRGLLCESCNQGIGFLRDDPQLMEEAARYLRSPRTDVTPRTPGPIGRPPQPVKHGTRHAYEYWACRCAACSAVEKQHWAEQDKARRSRKAAAVRRVPGRSAPA